MRAQQNILSPLYWMLKSQEQPWNLSDKLQDKPEKSEVAEILE